MNIYQSLVLIVLLGGSLSAYSDLEHLDTQNAAQLTDQFEKADSLNKDQLIQLRNSGWLCEMYGMRSRIQVEKGIKLYHFHDSESPIQLKNSGAQIIKSYSLSQGLRGSNGSLLEEIRLSKQGSLISRLEIKDLHTNGLRTLAISVCERLKS